MRNRRVLRYSVLSARSDGKNGLILRASAKVNLGLEILGKREDGYHELVTVLQAVDLSDRLTLEEAEQITLTVSDPSLPANKENLAWRAARLLSDAAGVDRGVRITLDKHIPVAAGLGGGSSDAAAVLCGVNRLWRLDWPAARLQELAAEIGMDVPFFLGNGLALGTGRGERLQPLPSKGEMALVLVNPNFPLSTRDVYGRVRAEIMGDGKKVTALLAALATGDVARVAQAIYNTLEAAVEPAYPLISEVKRALRGAGALGCVMSGSGPTVAGLAQSLSHARRIADALSSTSWSCRAVRTISGPPIRVVRWGVAKR